MGNMKKRKAAERASDSRYSRGWKPLRAALSVLVAAGTLGSLMLPAITMNQECTLQEHLHNEECQVQLACTYASMNVHTHVDSCYDEAQRLVCGKADFVVHSHDELCYDAAGALVCTLLEVEAHVHDEECYVYPVVEPGHAHGDDCYVCTYGEAIVCALAEDDTHTHTEECHEKIRGELVCTEEEREPVLAEEPVLVCEKPVVIAHLHEELCYAPEEPTEPTKAVTEPTEAATEPTEAATEPTEAATEPTEAATEPTEASTEPTEAVTEPTEAATEPTEAATEPTEAATEPTEAATEPTEAATEPTEAVTEPTEAATEPTEAATEPAEETVPERELICEYLEVPVHQHTEACFKPTACLLEEHVHVNSCFPGVEPEQEDPASWEVLLTSQWSIDLETIALNQLGYTESTANRILADDGEIRGYTRYGHWAGAPHAPWQTLFLSFCMAYADIPEEAIPRGEDLQSWLAALAEKDLLRQEGEPLPGDLVILDRDGDGTADTGAVLVRRIDENGQELLYTLEGDYENAVGCLPYDAAAVVQYVSLDQAYVAYLQSEPEEKPFSRVCQGADYTITANYGPEAGFPEDVTMSVRELESGSEEYLAHVEQLLAAGVQGDIRFLRLFDVTFLDAQGNALEPDASVEMKVLYDHVIGPEEGMDYAAVHFDEKTQSVETVEVTPVTEESGVTGMEFSQGSFSVLGTMMIDEPSENTAVPYADTPGDGTSAAANTSSITMSDGPDSDTYRRTTDPVTMNDWADHFTNDLSLINTSNAGGVWMDKSVTAGSITYSHTPVGGVASGGTIEAGQGKFLVGLSAIAATQSVTGLDSAPTDVMFILDMSSSMYSQNADGSTGSASDRNPKQIQLMLEALNESVKTLFSLNVHNRIGVVLYCGYSNVTIQSSNEHSMVLLPLGRYVAGTDGTFLTADLDTSQKLTGVSVSDGVRVENGDEYSNEHKINHGHDAANRYIAGTYAQAGLLNAMEEFLDADTVVDADTPRYPVFVFMSDGEPTAATEEYTEAHLPEADGSERYAETGNNAVRWRNAAESDFMTQLTAAYAKAQVSLHYDECGKDALFYSLALGSSISLDVMSPTLTNSSTANNTKGLTQRIDGSTTINLTAKISSYWDDLLSGDGKAEIYTRTYYHDSWTSYDKKHIVEVKQLEDGTAFPRSRSQQLYDDGYFSAADATQLKNEFAKIVQQIGVQSGYIVTKTETNQDTSGYVTFVDTIGEHMTVSDMEGMIFNGEFYTGRNLALNFLAPGVAGAPGQENNLGFWGEGGGTELGNAFVRNVANQLGMKPTEDFQKAAQVIDAAYNVGQFHYYSDSDFSHHIDWYAIADSSGNHTFVSFAHEAGQDCGHGYPDCGHMSPPAGATHKIRSYFFISPIKSEEDKVVKDTNMMYCMVWIRTNLENGQETVVAALPAALLPTVDYSITLDQQGKLTGLAVSGADTPAMLVYQVKLRDDVVVEKLVNEGTYDGIEYKKADNDEYVLDAEGNKIPTHVYFYSNAYDTSDYYSMTNTYSFFHPNEKNDRYYYTGPVNEKEGSKTWIYDANGNKITEAPVTDNMDPNTYQERFVYYSNESGTAQEMVTMKPISKDALLLAKKDEDTGHYYIPAGTPHTMTISTIDSAYQVIKTSNNTGTAVYSDYPFVNAATTAGYTIGAMQGNNGRLMLEPFYFSGTKTLTGVDLSTVDYEFTFELYKTGSSFDVASGTLLQSIKNSDTDSDNDPKTDDIVFDPVWPFGIGSHYYVIREVPSPGIISDTTEYLVTITIDADGSSIVEAKKRGTDKNLVDPSTRNISFDGADFTNSIGYELPATGGTGTEPYIFSGIGLLAGAAWIYMTQRKKEKGVQF